MVSKISQVKYISKEEAAKITREKLKAKPTELAKFEREEKTRAELREQAKRLKPPAGTPTAREVELAATGREQPTLRITAFQEAKAIGATPPKIKTIRQPLKKEIQISKVVDIRMRQVEEQRRQPVKETIRTEPGAFVIPSDVEARSRLTELSIQKREQEFKEDPVISKVSRVARASAFGLGGEEVPVSFITDKEVSRAVAETEQRTYSAMGIIPTTESRLKVVAAAPVPGLLGGISGGLVFGTATKIPVITEFVKSRIGKVAIGGTFAYTVGQEAKHVQELFKVGEKEKAIGAAGLSVLEFGGFVGGYRLATGKPFIPEIKVKPIMELKEVYGKNILTKMGLTEEMIAQKRLKIDIVEPIQTIRPFREPKKPITPKKPILEKPLAISPEERQVKDLFKFRYKDEPMIPIEKIPDITTGYIQKGEKIIFQTKTGPLEIIEPKVKVKTTGKPDKPKIIKMEDIIKPEIVMKEQSLIIRTPLRTEKQIIASLRKQDAREDRLFRVPEDLPKRGIKYEEMKVIKMKDKPTEPIIKKISEKPELLKLKKYTYEDIKIIREGKGFRIEYLMEPKKPKIKDILDIDLSPKAIAKRSARRLKKLTKKEKMDSIVVFEASPITVIKDTGKTQTFLTRTRKGMTSIYPKQQLKQIYEPIQKQTFITTQVRQVTPRIYEPRRQAFNRQFQVGMDQARELGYRFQSKMGMIEKTALDTKLKVPEVVKMKQPLIFGMLPTIAISETKAFRQRMMPEMKIIQEPVPIQILEPITRPKEKIKESIQTKEVRDVLFSTGLNQIYEPDTFIPESVKGISAPIKPIKSISDPIIHPGVPLLETLLKSEKVHKIEDVSGYNVLIPVRGKITKMNKGRMTRKQALSFGAEIVDNTEAASFTIKKSGLKAKPLRLSLPMFDQMKFRHRKKDNFFVEKNTYRIDTMGEIHGISAKAWAVNRMRGARNINRLLQGF